MSLLNWPVNYERIEILLQMEEEIVDAQIQEIWSNGLINLTTSG